MSDYGLLLLVRKRNEKLTENEISEIKTITKRLLEQNDLSNIFGQPFHCEIVHVSPKELAIKLSEYWGGEDDEVEKTFESAEELDLESGQILVHHLQSTLPENTEVQLKFTEW